MDSDKSRNPNVIDLHVSGFRSLRDFNISIRRGLNVVTGRNGSGKTNFIEFLDFLSQFVHEGIGPAVSLLGGTNKVFSQETLRTKSPRVTVKIAGTAKLHTKHSYYGIDTDRPYFRFEYNLEIRLLKKLAIVFVSKESLTLYRLHRSFEQDDAQRAIGTIALKRRYDQTSKSVITDSSIGPRLLSASIKNPFRYLMRPRATRTRDGAHSAEERAKALEEGVIGRTEETESFLGRGYQFAALFAVEGMLTRARSFNLLPSEIRKPSNITDAPMIAPNGSGLSASLYHMSKTHEQGANSHYMYNFDPEMMPKVVAWTQLLMPELSNITSIADLTIGKYLAFLWINSPTTTTNLRVPLQSASDGTLKWLSLAAKLAQDPQYLSLEEPENFLHPQMQTFLIHLLREATEDVNEEEGNLKYAIVSTHSETIINSCSPEELILFEFREHRTLCKRVSNWRKIVEQMNETGFGLGHYYVSNALS